MTSDPPRRRGVLFDLDGTLVDTNYPHVLAWWHAFRAAGYTVAMSDIHRKVGMGADLLVAAMIDRDDEAVATAHRHFYAPYLEQLQPFRRPPNSCARRPASGWRSSWRAAPSRRRSMRSRPRSGPMTW